jgi:hypothetical protein
MLHKLHQIVWWSIIWSKPSLKGKKVETRGPEAILALCVNFMSHVALSSSEHSDIFPGMNYRTKTRNRTLDSDSNQSQNRRNKTREKGTEKIEKEPTTIKEPRKSSLLVSEREWSLKILRRRDKSLPRTYRCAYSFQWPIDIILHGLCHRYPTLLPV